MNFIKKVSLNATIALTNKPTAADSASLTLENSSVTFNLCVHVDTSPIVISLSEAQVNNILSIGFSNLFMNV